MWGEQTLLRASFCQPRLYQIKSPDALQKYAQTPLDSVCTHESLSNLSCEGSLDPWHALGITEDLSPSAPAILIPVSDQEYAVSPTDSLHSALPKVSSLLYVVSMLNLF